MIQGEVKAKRRWRTKRSGRAIMALLLPVFLYLAAWETTHRISVPAVKEQVKEAWGDETPVAVAPFVVAFPGWGLRLRDEGGLLPTPADWWDYYLCCGRWCWRLTPQHGQ